MNVEIGIIGGSGLYAMDGLTVLYERTVETPFGAPSDPFVVGEVEAVARRRRYNPLGSYAFLKSDLEKNVGGSGRPP